MCSYSEYLDSIIIDMLGNRDSFVSSDNLYVVLQGWCCAVDEAPFELGISVEDAVNLISSGRRCA